MRPQPNRTVGHHVVKRSYASPSRGHHAIEANRCHPGDATRRDGDNNLETRLVTTIPQTR
jgi:hypothetical protein